MSIDIRKLIEQVEQRPPLWDRQNSGYFDKKLVARLWSEISKLQGVEQSIIKTKWKGLRDTYRIELRKYPQPSTWLFYKDMTFLRNHIKTRPIKPEEEIEKTNVKEEPIEPNCVFVTEYDVDNDRNSDVRPEERQSRSYQEHSLVYDDTMDVDAAGDNKDDDYHFLMSFLPEMRKLETKKKMLLRIKMMELFYKETYDSDYNNS